jgi:hypothetical protein
MRFYKLKDWIDEDKLYWGILSKNCNSVELLKQRPENWLGNLSANVNYTAIDLLKQTQRIDWEFIV